MMKETLARGESLKLSRFGTLLVRDKKQRTGRNPQTGEPMTIQARRVVNFKPSQSLRDEINQP
jgi:integration host factor subunit alpha